MEEDDQRELQLLPTPSPGFSCPPSDSSSKNRTAMNPSDPPSLELQLSISLRPARPSPSSVDAHESKTIDALKRHATEQIRLAAVEKAYAERVRELTRREMEMAESEFARARHVWERAREEVEKAERLKEKAVRRIDPTCMEITCQGCRQRFRP
ncbi:protein indeterminate-domain 16 [Magnolia sinica]|uniref:protein indeterminate-domain 16 n=1 Tax=Magnolia sinica TaxID=86752 RepID=UPI00265A52FB|nr:protein indeterminate-domain 16 [Magnolia sinica]